jgi:hypothetical protein
VSGNSRKRRFFTPAAMCEGNRNTMQHGLNRATAPAKKAVRIDPADRSVPT